MQSGRWCRALATRYCGEPVATTASGAAASASGGGAGCRLRRPARQEGEQWRQSRLQVTAKADGRLRNGNIRTQRLAGQVLFTSLAMCA
jgi:hypothetical protein